MTNKYYQKRKERLGKDVSKYPKKNIQIFLKKRKTKGGKMPEKDIKILLKKKKAKKASVLSER